jgi:hypothetical protein
MGRYVPRSGWAEQKTSRESCCGKTAIHHTSQPEFRRAKNCSFALRRLGQNREAKRARRSLPVSRQFVRKLETASKTAYRDAFPGLALTIGWVELLLFCSGGNASILIALRSPVFV